METYDKDALYKKNVEFYTESNPNPNSLKFVTNYVLFPEGESFDFPDADSASNAPLAKELFNFEYVDRVFFMNNFITITKKEDIDWIEIKTPLKDFIRNYVESDKPLLNEEIISEDSNNEDSEVVRKIKQVLDEYIKPAVEMDGGAITFDSFNEGIVKVQLQGSCSGCPSSTVTLKAGIENLLSRMIPEVNSVEAESV